MTNQSEPSKTPPEVSCLKLNREDSQALAEALLNPRPPNDALKAALKAYKEIFGT